MPGFARFPILQSRGKQRAAWEIHQFIAGPTNFGLCPRCRPYATAVSTSAAGVAKSPLLWRQFLSGSGSDTDRPAHIAASQSYEATIVPGDLRTIAHYEDHELDRSRGDADKVAAILGTRTIYDTVTGDSGYASLTDVTSVVDSLNQAALDPNRFQETPLCDQRILCRGGDSESSRIPGSNSASRAGRSHRRSTVREREHAASAGA
jgi:hypothetical protein